MVTITPLTLLTEIYYKAVSDPRAGAIELFLGVVRNHSEGKGVLYLEYEAFEEMAKKELGKIVHTMTQQWPLYKVAIGHRLGRLEIGETSVIVAVSSAHRSDAFMAGRYGIDTIKQTVPIWKREFFADGSVTWSKGEDCSR